MNKLILFLILFPLISLGKPKPSEPEKFDSSKIWLGIPASVFVGYGLGHAVQKRYKDTGWIYTVVEGTGTLLVFLTLGDCASKDSSCQDQRQKTGDVGRVLWFGGRLVEAIDSSVWSYNYYQRTHQEISLLPQKDGASLVWSGAF